MANGVGLMREFHSCSDDIIRRTRRRVFIEVSAFVLLAGFFWSNLTGNWPIWLKLSVMAFFSAYILFGLAYYPKAKSIAQKFSVHLMDEALVFPSQGDMKQIPWKDLIISKVTKKNDEVVKIHLKTKFGQSITLQGFENMKELSEDITNHVGRSK